MYESGHDEAQDAKQTLRIKHTWGHTVKDLLRDVDAAPWSIEGCSRAVVQCETGSLSSFA